MIEIENIKNLEKAIHKTDVKIITVKINAKIITVKINAKIEIKSIPKKSK